MAGTVMLTLRVPGVLARSGRAGFFMTYEEQADYEYDTELNNSPL